jgi:hypothetical protein
MPPASFDGVMDSTRGFTDWTLEMFPRHVLESQFQAFGSPSKRHSATRHCRPKPSAAVKSSSGVILLIESTTALKMQIPPLSLLLRPKYLHLLRLRDRSEERAKGYRTQKAVTFPSAE